MPSPPALHVAAALLLLLALMVWAQRNTGLGLRPPLPGTLPSASLPPGKEAGGENRAEADGAKKAAFRAEAPGKPEVDIAMKSDLFRFGGVPRSASDAAARTAVMADPAFRRATRPLQDAYGNYTTPRTRTPSLPPIYPEFGITLGPYDSATEVPSADAQLQEYQNLSSGYNVYDTYGDFYDPEGKLAYPVHMASATDMAYGQLTTPDQDPLVGSSSYL